MIADVARRFWVEPPVGETSVKDLEQLPNREEFDRLKAEWAWVPLPKSYTNCIAVVRLGP